MQVHIGVTVPDRVQPFEVAWVVPSQHPTVKEDSPGRFGWRAAEFPNAAAALDHLKTLEPWQKWCWRYYPPADG